MKPKWVEGLANRELELAGSGLQVNKPNYDRKADRPMGVREKGDLRLASHPHSAACTGGNACLT